MMQPKTLLLGLGNTILRDDAVGVIVARAVYDALIRADVAGQVAFCEASCAGWNLIDLLAGYERVVVIDAIQTGQGPPGECFKVEIEEQSLHFQFSHGIGLAEAVALLKADGRKAPETITVYGIEVIQPYAFGEGLNSAVQEKIPSIVEQIIAEEQWLVHCKIELKLID
jgi:hydrogenase maturation protease